MLLLGVQLCSRVRLQIEGEKLFSCLIVNASSISFNFNTGLLFFKAIECLSS